MSGIAAVLLTLTGAPVHARGKTQPTVACHLHYGGDTLVHRATPTDDPYEERPIAVGSYFLFKTVLQTAPSDIASVKTYVYADLPQGPMLVHQMSVPWVQARQRRGSEGYTGWQQVHEPMRDGELQYWCGVEWSALPATTGRNASGQASVSGTFTLDPAMSEVPNIALPAIAMTDATAARGKSAARVTRASWTLTPPWPAPGSARDHFGKRSHRKVNMARANAVSQRAPHAPDARTTSSAAAPAVTPPKRDEVRLVFAGDIMLDDGPGRTIAAGGDPLQPFDAILRDADVAIGNLESPIAEHTTGEALDNKIYTFRASPQSIKVLKNRFDALTVANNHSGDYGHTAFMETLTRLQEAGILTFGGGRNLTEAHAPLWITRNGVRIAVLGYNEFKPRRFEAGPTWPGVAWSEDEQVVSDIRAARRAGADVIIPFMHWGWERETKPSERQRALARRMIDAGADVVIGSHPHVTQGADHYKGKPIIWSLGNFVFDGFDLPAAKVGWLLRLAVDRKGVRHWSTIEAVIDQNGTPYPSPDVNSPRGERGKYRAWP